MLESRSMFLQYAKRTETLVDQKKRGKLKAEDLREACHFVNSKAQCFGGFV